ALRSTIFIWQRPVGGQFRRQPGRPAIRDGQRRFSIGSSEHRLELVRGGEGTRAVTVTSCSGEIVVKRSTVDRSSLWAIWPHNLTCLRVLFPLLSLRARKFVASVSPSRR